MVTMKKFVLLVLLCTLASPAFALNKVSVAEAEERLASAGKKSDGSMARMIREMELTERCSNARLERWQATYPGKQTHDALLLLADASALHHLPASDLPSDPEPSMDEQRRIVRATIHYLAETLPALPNFLATRRTIFFNNTPDPHGFDPATVLRDADTEPLQMVGHSEVNVAYRDGHEVLDQPAKKTSSQSSTRLATTGEFGPILQVVLVDAAHGQTEWSHWEMIGNQRGAAFRYAVPAENSHYQLTIPCGTGSPEHHPAYHGEFVVDPETGTILRLTVAARLPLPCEKVSGSIATEYGTVQIGSKNYICPLHSVSISYQPILFPIRMGRGQTSLEMMMHSVNDVVFTNYRRFRSESRIVSFGEEVPREPSRAHD